MKQILYYFEYLTLVIIVFFSIFGFVKFASASDVIFSQTAHNANAIGYDEFTAINGGLPGAVNMWVNVSGTGNGTFSQFYIASSTGTQFCQTSYPSYLGEFQNLPVGELTMATSSESWKEMDNITPCHHVLIPGTNYKLQVGYSGNATGFQMGAKTASGTTYDRYTIFYNGPFPYTGSTLTRIEWINPPITTPSATTSTSTSFQFRYYLNSQTDNPNTFTKILLQTCYLSYPNQPCDSFTLTPTVIPDSLTTITETHIMTKVGYTLGVVNFFNGVSTSTTETSCLFWIFGCNTSTTTSPIVGKGSSNKFNVATTTINLQLEDFGFGQQNALNACDQAILGTQAICKALVYLFVPNDDPFTDQMEQTTQVLQTKLPFYFYYSIINQMQNLASTTPSQVNQDINVNMANTFINGTTTMIKWSEVKTFEDNVFGSAYPYLTYAEWILFSIGTIAIVLIIL